MRAAILSRDTMRSLMPIVRVLGVLCLSVALPLAAWAQDPEPTPAPDDPALELITSEPEAGGAPATSSATAMDARPTTSQPPLDERLPPFIPDEFWSAPAAGLGLVLLALVGFVLGRGLEPADDGAPAQLGLVPLAGVLLVWFAAAASADLLAPGPLCGHTLAHIVAGSALLAAFRWSWRSAPGNALHALLGSGKSAVRSVLLGAGLAMVVLGLPLLMPLGPMPETFPTYPWGPLVSVALLAALVQSGCAAWALELLRPRWGLALALATVLVAYAAACLVAYLSIWHGPGEPAPMLVALVFTTGFLALGLLLQHRTASAVGLVPLVLASHLALINLFPPAGAPGRVLLSLGLVLLAALVLALLPNGRADAADDART